MKKLMTLFMMICLMVLSQTGAAHAAYGETAGDYIGGMGRKLGRGVWNVVSSPAEIPCTITAEMGDQGDGAWTGIGRGSWYFFRRLVVGATEIMTFILPNEKTIPGVCGGEKIVAGVSGV